jgi:type III restriction enzyme
MKFKFEELQYQQNAIDSVVKIFRGQEPKQSNFTVLSSTRQIGIAENITEDGNSIGIGNKLS